MASRPPLATTVVRVKKRNFKSEASKTTALPKALSADSEDWDATGDIPWRTPSLRSGEGAQRGGADAARQVDGRDDDEGDRYNVSRGSEGTGEAFAERRQPHPYDEPSSNSESRGSFRATPSSQGSRSRPSLSLSKQNSPYSSSSNIIPPSSYSSRQGRSPATQSTRFNERQSQQGKSSLFDAQVRNEAVSQQPQDLSSAKSKSTGRSPGSGKYSAKSKSTGRSPGSGKYCTDDESSKQSVLPPRPKGDSRKRETKSPVKEDQSRMKRLKQRKLLKKQRKQRINQLVETVVTNKPFGSRSSGFEDEVSSFSSLTVPFEMEGKEQADALAQELKDRGYDLECRSFLSGSGMSPKSPTERYLLALAEESVIGNEEGDWATPVENKAENGAISKANEQSTEEMSGTSQLPKPLVLKATVPVVQQTFSQPEPDWDGQPAQPALRKAPSSYGPPSVSSDVMDEEGNNELEMQANLSITSETKEEAIDSNSSSIASSIGAASGMTNTSSKLKAESPRSAELKDSSSSKPPLWKRLTPSSKLESQNKAAQVSALLEGRRGIHRVMSDSSALVELAKRRSDQRNQRSLLSDDQDDDDASNTVSKENSSGIPPIKVVRTISPTNSEANKSVAQSQRPLGLTNPTGHSCEPSGDEDYNNGGKQGEGKDNRGRSLIIVPNKEEVAAAKLTADNRIKPSKEAAIVSETLEGGPTFIGVRLNGTNLCTSPCSLLSPQQSPVLDEGNDYVEQRSVHDHDQVTTETAHDREGTGNSDQANDIPDELVAPIDKEGRHPLPGFPTLPKANDKVENSKRSDMPGKKKQAVGRKKKLLFTKNRFRLHRKQRLGKDESATLLQGLFDVESTENAASASVAEEASHVVNVLVSPANLAKTEKIVTVRRTKTNESTAEKNKSTGQEEHQQLREEAAASQKKSATEAPSNNLVKINRENDEPKEIALENLKSNVEERNNFTPGTTAQPKGKTVPSKQELEPSNVGKRPLRPIEGNLGSTDGTSNVKDVSDYNRMSICSLEPAPITQTKKIPHKNISRFRFFKKHEKRSKPIPSKLLFRSGTDGISIKLAESSAINSTSVASLAKSVRTRSGNDACVLDPVVEPATAKVGKTYDLDPAGSPESKVFGPPGFKLPRTTESKASRPPTDFTVSTLPKEHKISGPPAFNIPGLPVPGHPTKSDYNIRYELPVQPHRERRVTMRDGAEKVQEKKRRERAKEKSKNEAPLHVDSNQVGLAGSCTDLAVEMLSPANSRGSNSPTSLATSIFQLFKFDEQDTRPEPELKRVVGVALRGRKQGDVGAIELMHQGEQDSSHQRRLESDQRLANDDSSISQPSLSPISQPEISSVQQPVTSPVKIIGTTKGQIDNTLIPSQDQNVMAKGLTPGRKWPKLKWKKKRTEPPLLSRVDSEDEETPAMREKVFQDIRDLPVEFCDENILVVSPKIPSPEPSKMEYRRSKEKEQELQPKGTDWILNEFDSPHGDDDGNTISTEEVREQLLRRAKSRGKLSTWRPRNRRQRSKAKSTAGTPISKALTALSSPNNRGISKLKPLHVRSSHRSSQQTKEKVSDSSNKWDMNLHVEEENNSLIQRLSGESRDSQSIGFPNTPAGGITKRTVSDLSNDSLADVEDALRILKKHAIRLGVKEADLLAAVKSEDTLEDEPFNFGTEVWDAVTNYFNRPTPRHSVVAD